MHLLYFWIIIFCTKGEIGLKLFFLVMINFYLTNNDDVLDLFKKE